MVTRCGPIRWSVNLVWRAPFAPKVDPKSNKRFLVSLYGRSPKSLACAGQPSCGEASGSTKTHPLEVF